VYSAKGTIRIIDKDGNVKGEFEVTDIQVEESDADQPNECPEQHGGRD
jgi:hypothetical protein